MSSLSQLSLNNTESVIADSIHLIVGTELKNIYDIFATRHPAFNCVNFAWMRSCVVNRY